MTIDTNKRKTVSPGDTVTVKGKATPGSFMAFRAVDKSVLLMKEDTDISVKKVISCYRHTYLTCEYSVSLIADKRVNKASTAEPQFTDTSP